MPKLLAGSKFSIFGSEGYVILSYIYCLYLLRSRYC
nr:MAG TPA: hypothetical protein [Crassvirales sp.]DAV77061.1 MAG TPA: hypothetical protein [Caudoviricetes sp.]